VLSSAEFWGEPCDGEDGCDENKIEKLRHKSTLKKGYLVHFQYCILVYFKIKVNFAFKLI
jgi:hypothetical protein